MLIITKIWRHNAIASSFLQACDDQQQVWVSAWYKGKEAWPSTSSTSQLHQSFLQSKLRGSRFNQRARTTRDGRACVIKRRYNNIGVILIFIMSFNIEDTSTSSFIQTYYMPRGWQLRNFLCGNFQQERDKLLFDKHENATIRRERIIQQKKLSTQRPRTVRSRDVIESTLPKDWTENANRF